MLVKTLNHRSI